MEEGMLHLWVIMLVGSLRVGWLGAVWGVLEGCIGVYVTHQVGHENQVIIPLGEDQICRGKGAGGAWGGEKCSTYFNASKQRG